MNTACHIVMIAAENDALPEAKVGGIGDVLRDLPDALAAAGCQVTVLIPAYGRLHTLPGATPVHQIEVAFGGEAQSVTAFAIPDTYQYDAARCLVLDHPLFGTCGGHGPDADNGAIHGAIYCDDPPDQPFATDASKFALFCASCATLLREGALGEVQVIHLHDWHSAMVAILRALSPDYEALRALRCVYSIHNLALQGIRPFNHHASSLARWFPELAHAPMQLADPRWPDCVNAMAAGIRLSDRVHTVSPTYAQEIQQPNDPTRGFHGGEGLEADLVQVASDGRLQGIINAIPDRDATPNPRLELSELSTQAIETLLGGIARQPERVRPVDLIALERARQWVARAAPAHLLTSVGRLTTQKLAILLSDTEKGVTCLDQLLLDLTRHNGVLCLLGTGEPAIEQQCMQLAARHPNFLFMNSYAQALGDRLYASGDLFLMPSSFEPCGISQMRAMQAGQPCLVHGVGGLRDTVRDDVDGFAFSGESLPAQASALLRRLDSVLELRERYPAKAKAVASAARKRLFRWADSVPLYIDELYRP